MKYTLVKLDGRYSYHQNFQFYLGFANSMARQSGPRFFNDAMVWFTERYGWSAEIRQWHHIEQWTSILGQPRIKAQPLRMASGILAEPSEHCNSHWSWSNTHADLRIYVATEQELAFWQLAHPVDQKKR